MADQTGTERRTFLLDTARMTIDGAFTTLVQSVFLLVAIKVFRAGTFMNGTIAAAPAVGMMGSLFYAAAFAGSGVRRAALAATPGILGGLLLLASGWAGGALVYGVLVSLAVIAHRMAVPFLLGIYSDNYAPRRRGKLLSVGLTLSLVVSAGTSLWFGRLLDADLAFYRPILTGAGAGLIVASALVLLIPTRRVVRSGEGNPLRNLSIVVTDPRFGMIVLSWFLAGFANLWSQPVRVAYLAAAERGLDLSPMTVLILTSALPSATRVLFTPVWAVFFDRVEFLSLRIVMNLFMGGGILIFFLSQHLWVITLGTIILSIGMAGTFVAWNLWVTKIAPPGQEQLYMSVHTFFTGVRGFLGPYLGFLFAARMGYLPMGVVSFALTAVSSILLYGILRTRPLR
jgi:hypothetical protein